MASRSIYKSIISSIFSIVITVGIVYAVIVVDGTIIFIILSVLTLLIIGGVYISYSKSSYKEKELEKVIRENVLRYAGWELPQFSMGGNMINIDFQQDSQSISIKEQLEALCNSRPNWIKLKENIYHFCIEIEPHKTISFTYEIGRSCFLINHPFSIKGVKYDIDNLGCAFIVGGIFWIVAIGFTMIYKDWPIIGSILFAPLLLWISYEFVSSFYDSLFGEKESLGDEFRKDSGWDFPAIHIEGLVDHNSLQLGGDIIVVAFDSPVNDSEIRTQLERLYYTGFGGWSKIDDDTYLFRIRKSTCYMYYFTYKIGWNRFMINRYMA